MIARSERRGARGFTLAEVMIALAILGMALTMLVRSIAGNIGSAQQAMYMGIVADLGRGKMYDIEEHLAQEGFKDTEEQEEGAFDDEGWPGIKWEYKVIPVELPSFDKLVGLAQGGGSGSGSGSGSDADGDGAPDPAQLARFQDSMFGQMMTMFGGMGGDSGGGGPDLSMIQMAYPMIQDVLKKSIRKVVLTIRWDTGFEAEHVDFVTFLTDIPSMCKAIPGGLSVTGPVAAGRRGRRERGLTLVEIMIAMAIMALMMMLAWTTIHSAGDARGDFEAIEDRNSEVRVAMARMVNDLESAYLSKNENQNLDNRRTLMKGKNDEITFSTFSHTPMWADANESDQTVVMYYIDQDRRLGKQSLFRRELRRTSNERIDSEPAEIDVMLGGIEKLELSYWDWKDKDWQSSWDTTKLDGEKDRLPVRIRIAIEYKNPRGDTLKLQTQARLLMQEALQY